MGGVQGDFCGDGGGGGDEGVVIFCGVLEGEVGDAAAAEVRDCHCACTRALVIVALVWVWLRSTCAALVVQLELVVKPALIAELPVRRGKGVVANFIRCQHRTQHTAWETIQ